MDAMKVIQGLLGHCGRQRDLAEEMALLLVPKVSCGSEVPLGCSLDTYMKDPPPLGLALWPSTVDGWLL